MFRYISQRAQLVRSYYSGIGKTAIIYPASFLVAMALVQMTLGLIFFVRDVFGATPAQVGWLAGTWSLCYAAGCVAVRPIFHGILPRHLIAGSMLGACCLAMAMQIVPSLGWIFVLHGAAGMIMSLFWPPLMGWLSSDREGAVLGRLMSRFNLSWCSGNTLGPFLCGWLVERDVRLPLFFGAGLFLLTAAFVAGAASALPRVRGDVFKGTNHTEDLASGMQSTPLRFPAWVGLFAAFFGFGMLMSIFPVFARDELGLKETTIGVLFLTRALLIGSTFALLGRFTFWHFRRWPMLVGQVLGVTIFLALVSTRSFWTLCVLMALTGVSNSVSYSESVFHGASGSQNRARRMGIHEATLALGMVCGAVSGGLLYQSHGMGAVYLLCASALAVGLVVQVLLCLRPTCEGVRNAEV